MTTKNHADQASLSSLRALALAATPGPWYHGAKNGAHKYCVYDKICWLDVDGSRWGDTPNIVISVSPDDGEYKTAAYIAAANPDAVLALLDELDAANTSRRAAQARVAELTEQVQKLGRELHRHKLDTARLDWLADRENAIGNVQLPTECVQAHPESLRAAIDAAMSMEGGAA